MVGLFGHVMHDFHTETAQAREGPRSTHVESFIPSIVIRVERRPCQFDAKVSNRPSLVHASCQHEFFESRTHTERERVCGPQNVVGFNVGLATCTKQSQWHRLDFPKFLQTRPRRIKAVAVVTTILVWPYYCYSIRVIRIVLRMEDYISVCLVLWTVALANFVSQLAAPVVPGDRRSPCTLVVTVGFVVGIWVEGLKKVDKLMTQHFDPNLVANLEGQS